MNLISLLKKQRIDVLGHDIIFDYKIKIAFQ